VIQLIPQSTTENTQSFWTHSYNINQAGSMNIRLSDMIIDIELLTE